MALVKLYNTSNMPVHLDADGHVLGAGEHGEGHDNDPVVSAHLAAGRLIVIADPEPEALEPVEPPKAPKTKQTKQED